MALLCVDPDAEAAKSTEEALTEAGFDVVTVGGLDDARVALEEASIDCLVTEYDLGEETGLDLIRAARERYPDVACVLFTDAPFAELEGAVGDTVLEYLNKDVDGARADLVSLVEHSVGVRSQTAYPLPENEEARLAALDRYAKHPGDLSAALDRLSRIATATFEVNSAAVGLVDERHERFLSCFGADFGEMPRERTICTYAILEAEPTVVENVQTDPRFADDEDLAAAGIRFYAGAPMRTPDGHAIGTFCIHDDEPRTFDQAERDLLALFAQQAMEQLELRRQIAELGGVAE